MLKILLLIGVIAASYYGYRAYGRWEAAKARDEEEKRLREQARPPAPTQPPPSAAADVGGEDMVACPGCGTYRPVGASSPCETPNCPTARV